VSVTGRNGWESTIELKTRTRTRTRKREEGMKRPCSIYKQRVGRKITRSSSVVAPSDAAGSLPQSLGRDVLLDHAKPLRVSGTAYSTFMV
jgi:hypothetical protein